MLGQCSFLNIALKVRHLRGLISLHVHALESVLCPSLRPHGSGWWLHCTQIKLPHFILGICFLPMTIRLRHLMASNQDISSLSISPNVYYFLLILVFTLSSQCRYLQGSFWCLNGAPCWKCSGKYANVGGSMRIFASRRDLDKSLSRS